jgi:hypothetical protein
MTLGLLWLAWRLGVVGWVVASRVKTCRYSLGR